MTCPLLICPIKKAPLPLLTEGERKEVRQGENQKSPAYKNIS